MRGRLRDVMWLAFMCASVVSCASTAARSADARPAIRDTVWYVSVRARKDGRDRRALSDSLQFGGAVYERRAGTAPMTGSVNLVLRDSVVVTREVFMEQLRRRTTLIEPPDDVAVVYVHGFGTSLHECWLYAAQARLRSTAPAAWVPFCWPSHGAGVTWPSWGSIFVRAYEDDERSITRSRLLFAQAVRLLTESVGPSHLVLTSHSLGAQLVVGALQEDSVLAGTLRASPFRALAFIAPDISARFFADTALPQLTPLANRTVLYTSANDRALRISRAMHDTERAGLRTKPPLVRPGLEVVDITDGFAVESWFQKLFGNRHKITRSVAMLFDLGRVVGAGLPPSCRATASYAAQDSVGVWHLLRGQPPRVEMLAACQR